MDADLIIITKNKVNDNELTKTAEVVYQLNHQATINAPNKTLLMETKTKLLHSYPMLTAHIHLIWICLEAYPDILTGKKNFGISAVSTRFFRFSDWCLQR